MMRNIFYALLLITFNFAYGQSKIDTIRLNQGEVFDILLLTQNSGKSEALKSYFSVAFPVAKGMTYQSLPGFKIVKHTKGNHQPKQLVLGKWEDLEKRERFITQIIDKVPDFHERRRDIWSYFGLSYYEIKHDISLEIYRDKYHVATAYWLDSNKGSSKFYHQWKAAIKDMNGEITIELKDGKSPFGYQYHPSFFVITSWENETDFKSFQEHVQKLTMDNIQHVNEFLLK